MIFRTVIIFAAAALSIGLKSSPGYEMFDREKSGKELKMPDLNEISNFAAHTTRLLKRDSDDENDIDDDWEFWPPRIFPITPKNSQKQTPATEMLEPEISLRRNAAAAKINSHIDPLSGITDKETDSKTLIENDTNSSNFDQKPDETIDSEPANFNKEAIPKSIPAIENELPSANPENLSNSKLIEPETTLRSAPTKKILESKPYDIGNDNSVFERAFFKTDRSKISIFNKRLMELFPKLLLLAHDASNFALEKQGLEYEILWLSLYLSWLIKDGNFLVHEVSRPFEFTKYLFQLLVHRHSSTEKINAMVKGIPEYRPVGEFHLQLVEFEIGLFELLRPDTKFKSPATKEFRDIVGSIKTSLIQLLEKFKEVVPEKSVFHVTFRNQLRHFQAVYRGFYKVIVSSSSSSSSSSRKQSPATEPDASNDPDTEVIPIQNIYQGSYESMD